MTLSLYHWFQFCKTFFESLVKIMYWYSHIHALKGKGWLLFEEEVKHKTKMGTFIGL